MILYFQEFWFTAIASFLYFTAFIAQLAEFSGIEDDEYQYWIDAQVTAGVSILMRVAKSLAPLYFR